jgi:sortase A
MRGTKRLLAVTERLLFIAGGVLVGYYLYHRIEVERFEREQTQALEEARVYLSEHPAVSADALASADAEERKASALPDRPEIIGRIEAARVGLSAVIIDSVEDRQLGRAVGHFPETPMFGEGGNVALAAHRDLHFAPLKHLTLGDTITVTTMTNRYYYVVDSLMVVEPTAVQVLDPTDRSRLTLVTCYPFEYIGHAPHRFIVRALEVPEPPPGAVAAEHGATSAVSAGVLAGKIDKQM